jgi:hypothetical protein
VITLLAAALMFAADTPKPNAGPALPPPPKGAPVPMPDTGKADPDSVCFVAGTFASRDRRAAGQDPALSDMETTYFAALMVRRYDDAALARALGAAEEWVDANQMDRVHAACDDRYARDIQRMRVANATVNRK